MAYSGLLGKILHRPPIWGGEEGGRIGREVERIGDVPGSGHEPVMRPRTGTWL